MPCPYDQQGRFREFLCVPRVSELPQLRPYDRQCRFREFLCVPRVSELPQLRPYDRQCRLRDYPCGLALRSGLEASLPGPWRDRHGSSLCPGLSALQHGPSARG